VTAAAKHSKMQDQSCKAQHCLLPLLLCCCSAAAAATQCKHACLEYYELSARAQVCIAPIPDVDCNESLFPGQHVAVITSFSSMPRLLMLAKRAQQQPVLIAVPGCHSSDLFYSKHFIAPGW
jgi:hypothetical protein